MGRSRDDRPGPVTRYRFGLDIPGGYRRLTARGVTDRDVPDDTDFRLAAHLARAGWAIEWSSLEACRSTSKAFPRLCPMLFGSN